MKDKKKAKLLEIALIAGLMVCLLAQNGYSIANIFLEGSGIQLEIPSGGAIAFGNENEGIVINVTTGTLNGTASFTYWRERGEIKVQSENAAAFTIDAYGDAKPRFGGGQTATQYNSTRILGTTINGDSLLFGWGKVIEPLLPYMFIIGVVGIFTFFGGLLWAAARIRDGDYIDGLRKGVIFCSIGFGLIWGWLNL